MQEPPVFADPTGRRHRRLRRLGIAAGGVLLACLGVVAVALAGGPRAPFISWAVPKHATQAEREHGPGREPAARQLPAPSPSPELSPGSAPSPQVSPSRPGSRKSVSPSPALTNPAGHTPPGLIHRRSPGPKPHKSPHGG
ncbi:MAG TPA: hypothetical protein VGI64_08440 [Streptosporangiaceae bacterium]